ncbi:MAG: DUF4870 domain-containing protein [Planctomycetota bacterium]|jgi:uncharacterized Tic20 family protein
MTEINQNPQNPGIPGSQPNAAQPVNAEPAASTEPPVNPEPPPNTEQPVNFQPERVSKEVNKDARMWSMFCHLGGLAALLPILPVLGGIIAPLIIWQIKKDEHPFVDEQGKEAVNFQISILIYELVAGILTFACVGVLLLPAVMIFDIVFLVIAAIKANNGFHYQYPLCIRFIK